MSLISAVTAAAILAPFARGLSRVLTGTPDHAVLVLLIVTSLPFFNVSSVLGYVLQGFTDVSGLTRANVGTAAASVVCLLLATGFLGLFGAVISILITSVLQVALFIVPVLTGVRRRSGTLRLLAISWPTARSLLSYGGYVMAGGIAIWAGLLIVRTIAIHLLGNYENGLYQVAFGFSNQATTVFMTWMGAYVFPRVAASNRGSMPGLLNSALRANLVVIVPLLVVGIALRAQLTGLFYSATFVPAAPLLSIQAFGDLLRVVGWSFGVSLFAHGFVRAHFAIVAGQSAAWVLLSLVTIPLLGLPGVATAYTLSFVIYPAVAIPCTTWWFRATPSGENIILIAASFGCLAAAAVTPSAVALLAAPLVPALVLAGRRWQGAAPLARFR
jgi:O-antigen/teichoic acid export membrane protein